MFEKNRLKKDGSDKHQENQAQRTAEANPERKHEPSSGKPKDKFPSAKP